ncbi:MAG: hypothetical protein RL670_1102 [Actinomycetota bacterium]
MYLAINIPFVAFALVAMLLLTPRNRWAGQLVTLIPMLLLTAIFDNLIIGSGIVAYDTAKISGWMIGIAPIEDFFYTVAAVLLIPAVWTYLGRVKK